MNRIKGIRLMCIPWKLELSKHTTYDGFFDFIK